MHFKCRLEVEKSTYTLKPLKKSLTINESEKSSEPLKLCLRIRRY